MKHTNILSLSAFSALLLVSGCADEPDVVQHQCDPIPKGHPDRDGLEAIDALGLCGSSAVDVGDGYVVEGDIFIARSTLADKQARHSSLVSTANIRDVTIRVDSDMPNDGGDDDWHAAIQQAIADWNAVPFNLVRLVPTTSTEADITITSSFLEDDVLARSDWPSGGEAGRFIQINLSFENNWPLTEEQKHRNALHEIGHAIGLRHTNWATYNESGASNIPGTPTSDPESVMNQGQWSNSTGLTANDRLAIRLVYPEIVTHLNEYAGCSGGTPRLASTWGGTLVQPTIEWQLERKIGSTWSQVYRGTGQTWTFNVPTGTTLQARVRGRSSEGWSVYRNVTKTAPSCNTPPQ